MVKSRNVVHHIAAVYQQETTNVWPSWAAADKGVAPWSPLGSEDSHCPQVEEDSDQSLYERVFIKNYPDR